MERRCWSELGRRRWTLLAASAGLGFGLDCAPVGPTASAAVPPSPPQAGLECFGALERLDLRHNLIRDVGPLGALHELVELKLSYNEIADLSSLAALPRLERLWIDDNQIEDLSPLAQLTRLRELSLSNNRARDLTPLGRLTELEQLQAGRNRILELAPLRPLNKLTSLGLHHNCIANLQPVASLTKLQQLNVSFNYVTSIAPLAAMTQLEHLTLSGNYFKGLSPLGNLHQLKSLFMDSTGQTDVSALIGLKRFNIMTVQRNPIDCEAQAENLRILERSAKLQGGSVAHDCTPPARPGRARGPRDPKPAMRDKTRDERCKVEPASAAARHRAPRSG